MSDNVKHTVTVGPVGNKHEVIVDIKAGPVFIHEVDIDAEYGEKLTEHSLNVLKDIKAKGEEGTLSFKQLGLFKAVAMGLISYERPAGTGLRSSKYEDQKRSIVCVWSEYVDGKMERCTTKVSGTPKEIGEKRNMCAKHNKALDKKLAGKKA